MNSLAMPVARSSHQFGSQVELLPGVPLSTAVIVIACVLAIGVFAYPDTKQLMPLGIAAIVLGLVGICIVMSGRLRLLILLPLVASYLPSPEVGFVALIFALWYFVIEYGVARCALPLDRLDWAFLAVCGWTVVAWLANLGDQTDLWSLPLFFVTFLSPWALLFIARAADWKRDDLRLILAVWILLSIAQAVTGLVKPVVIGLPEAYAQPLEIFDLSGVSILVDMVRGGGDTVTGTMVSAHHLGVLLVLTGVYLVSLRRLVVPRGWAVMLLLVAYVFLMTSAKHVSIAAIPAAAIYLWKTVWPSLKPRARSALIVAGLAVAFVGGSYVATFTQRVVIEGLWRPVFVLASFNPKVQLYTRTLARFTPRSASTWIGYGPGAYASRAASIRATDVLYKETTQLPSLIPPHTGPAYRDVMYDLYTSGIVETVSNRSGVLTNPFSSVIGILGEYGIIGTVVLLWFLGAAASAGFRCWFRQDVQPEWRAIGATAAFSIPLLVGLGLFDSYFEQPDVVAPLVIVIFLSLTAGRSSVGTQAIGVDDDRAS